MTARALSEDKDSRFEITLTHRGTVPALAAKITMLAADGTRILPVYYSDNYLMMMPGEVRKIVVRCPAAGARCAQAALRGWNVARRSIRF